MEHLTQELAEGSGLHTEEAAQTKIKEWGINTRGMDRLLERTQRVNIALTLNPKIINPELGSSDRIKYLQLLYSHAPILAISLADLKEPANVEPMHIRTFGQPIKRNPIRLA